MSGDAPLVDAYGRNIRLVRRKNALYMVLGIVYVIALVFASASAPWAELSAQWRTDWWEGDASAQPAISFGELALVSGGAWLYSILIAILAYFDLLSGYGTIGSPYAPVMAISLSIMILAYALVRCVIGFELSRTWAILGITMAAFLVYLVIDRHVSEC